jgi:DNA-binding response OmpR family regulator
MAGKILIIEDDRAIAQSLGRLLGREEYFVESRRTAEEGLAHLREDAAYDLILLDVMLPGANGFDCCRQIRELGWRGPIIMLTGRSSAAYKIAGLECGADDYVTKPFDPAELLARVQAQLRRTREYDAPLAQAQAILLAPELTLDLPSRTVSREGRPIALTDREFELLALLARHQDTALDKTWLYRQIWGGASELGIKVLAVYMRRLRRKIEVDMDNPLCLLTVRGHGYKLAACPPHRASQDEPPDAALDKDPAEIVR